VKTSSSWFDTSDKVKEAALSPENFRAMVDRIKSGDPKMTELGKKWTIATMKARGEAKNIISGAKARSP
jgi:hypothetical protein